MSNTVSRTRLLVRSDLEKRVAAASRDVGELRRILREEPFGKQQLAHAQSAIDAVSRGFPYVAKGFLRKHPLRAELGQGHSADVSDPSTILTMLSVPRRPIRSASMNLQLPPNQMEDCIKVKKALRELKHGIHYGEHPEGSPPVTVRFLPRLFPMWDRRLQLPERVVIVDPSFPASEIGRLTAMALSHDFKAVLIPEAAEAAAASGHVIASSLGRIDVVDVLKYSYASRLLLHLQTQGYKVAASVPDHEAMLADAADVRSSAEESSAGTQEVSPEDEEHADASEKGRSAPGALKPGDGPPSDEGPEWAWPAQFVVPIDDVQRVPVQQKLAVLVTGSAAALADTPGGILARVHHAVCLSHAHRRPLSPLAMASLLISRVRWS
ncbi:hypothetical protein DIPPA_08352 [Diplonema papillatum]|nr:hypothetical protein DIPPA_08352 [Diplonema papillatum]